MKAQNEMYVVSTSTTWSGKNDGLSNCWGSAEGGSIGGLRNPPTGMGKVATWHGPKIMIPKINPKMTFISHQESSFLAKDVSGQVSLVVKR